MKDTQGRSDWWTLLLTLLINNMDTTRCKQVAPLCSAIQSERGLQQISQKTRQDGEKLWTLVVSRGHLCQSHHNSNKHEHTYSQMDIERVRALRSRTHSSSACEQLLNQEGKNCIIWAAGTNVVLSTRVVELRESPIDESQLPVRKREAVEHK